MNYTYVISIHDVYYNVPIETSHRCFVEGKMNFAKTAKIQWEI